MDCSTPGFPVHLQLPKLAWTHVHRVSDAIQPSHPLSSPSPTFNLSQHQGLFQWVSSLHQVAKVLEFHLQHQSFQWIFRTDCLWIDWFDLLAVQGTLKSLLAYFSSTYTKIGTVQRLAWPLCKDDMQIHEVIHMKKNVFFSTTIQKHQFFGAQPSLWSNSQHLYMTTGKTIALTLPDLCQQSGVYAF